MYACYLLEIISNQLKKLKKTSELRRLLRLGSFWRVKALAGRGSGQPCRRRVDIWARKNSKSELRRCGAAEQSG